MNGYITSKAQKNMPIMEQQGTYYYLPQALRGHTSV
jgi:hypothetical protein